MDVEWLRQAEMMLKYTRHSADMQKEMDEAKERLEVGKAQIEIDIRSAPDTFGLEKVTEAAIQSTILLQKGYQKLSQEYSETRHEYGVAVAAVRAFDQRKSALENLVRLLGASYFAGPQTPRDLSKESLDEKKRKEQNAKVKIQKRRRERD